MLLRRFSFSLPWDHVMNVSSTYIKKQVGFKGIEARVQRSNKKISNDQRQKRTHGHSIHLFIKLSPKEIIGWGQTLMEQSHSLEEGSLLHVSFPPGHWPFLYWCFWGAQYSSRKIIDIKRTIRVKFNSWTSYLRILVDRVILTQWQLNYWNAWIPLHFIWIHFQFALISLHTKITTLKKTGIARCYQSMENSALQKIQTVNLIYFIRKTDKRISYKEKYNTYYYHPLWMSSIDKTLQTPDFY